MGVYNIINKKINKRKPFNVEITFNKCVPSHHRGLSHDFVYYYSILYLDCIHFLAVYSMLFLDFPSRIMPSA